jgi:hypothetical protein
MHTYRRRLAYDVRSINDRAVYWPSRATSTLWCDLWTHTLNRAPEVINLEFESLAIKITGGFND